MALALSAMAAEAQAADFLTRLSLKQPGNKAVTVVMGNNTGRVMCDKSLPVEVTSTNTDEGADELLTFTVKAKQRVYFNLGIELTTELKTDDVEFYLPGFWYHRNLRSPKEAPSFHTSKSWNFRADRLSTPLTSAYSAAKGEGISVLQQNTGESADCLATHTEGEVILSGNTSVGYLGFDASGDKTLLTFGYPYIETPRRYIRKLTLAPSVEAFVKLEPGESKTLTWRIHTSKAADYGQFVANTWNYCFDRLAPQPLTPAYTPEQMKAQMANFFTDAFVDKYPLKYISGITMRCDSCDPSAEVQIGFCGRTLLNAFNALEYGSQTGNAELTKVGNAVFDSWLKGGFTDKGYLWDKLFLDRPMPSAADIEHSIRQQSEGAYAAMLYLDYERRNGRRHKEWESRVRTLLDNFVTLLKTDGSFARKFHDNGSDIDASGGSTPSATSALVMGYKYFGDKRYLATAKRTVDYLEKNIISKSDYFSSTLDANCEDKEAAISAVTATYYLAMVTKGKEQQHYTALCKKAMYFALSWYYLWDVPFAQGQMLGDLGLKSRGWGNVSVENNHIDVFVFELPHIMKWLGEKTSEKRFQQMYDVIRSSLCQLLPTKERLCGIGRPGYYPEVVQHTTWDYGRNGKGFYNDIFAPGWTVASLWELYSPNRTNDFLLKVKR